ncbi:MAG TPA: hypothetical protein VKZ18_04210 [Polyangia bacterium]|nr:hypothetical protein [Polyangia bacterium]
MNRRGVCALAAGAALVLGGCRARDWSLGPRAAAPAVTASTPIPLDRIDVTGGGGAVSYVVHLPAPPPGAPAQRLVLRFADPLDGAKVQAFARGPSGAETLVRDKRIGGTDVEVPLGALRWDTVDVVVHHHLRPAGVLTAAAVRVEASHARPL